MLHFQFGWWRHAPMLRVAAVLLAVTRATNAQNTSGTCSMIVGGGAILVRGYEVVFAAASDSLGSTLRGLAIVRASADFRSRPPSAATSERWESVRLRHPGSGANVGPLMVVHDASTNTIWLDDSLAVPLTGNNNVLLVDVNAHGAFTPIGQARIEPHFPVPVTACTEAAILQVYHETSDTLWARFQASPPIRSFVSP
jgi:hypothetical protein